MVDPLTGRVGDRRRECESLLILDALPGVGLVTIRRLVDAFGSATRVLRWGRKALRRSAGGDAARAASDADVRGRVRAALRRADELGIETLLWSDAAYPDRLHHLADPPPVLFLRGDPALLRTPGVAVVGGRKASARARSFAERLGGAIAAAGSPVVSGLALGVDGAAHRGALAVDGPTVAVMGRGADRAYPASHRGLFRGIVDHGLVVSEFPPGTPPLPHHFPRRNRVLAALATVVVVVEARERSGALITVEHGLDLGLDIWAVPGPVDEAHCKGSNALLADGARPLISVEHFVSRALGARPTPKPDETPAAEVGDAALVLEHLDDGPRTADDVARRAGMEVRRVLVAVSGLELRGRVRLEPDHRIRKAS